LSADERNVVFSCGPEEQGMSTYRLFVRFFYAVYTLLCALINATTTLIWLLMGHPPLPAT